MSTPASIPTPDPSDLRHLVGILMAPPVSIPAVARTIEGRAIRRVFAYGDGRVVMVTESNGAVQAYVMDAAAIRIVQAVLEKGKQ